VVYATALDGVLHCLNAKTGELFWEYDTRASIWGSPFFVDGKVLVPTQGCDLFVFKHDKSPKQIDGSESGKNAPDVKSAGRLHKEKRIEVEKEYLLAQIEFPGPMHTPPTVVNGVLFVATENTLFAIGKK